MGIRVRVEEMFGRGVRITMVLVVVTGFYWEVNDKENGFRKIEVL